MHRTDEVIPSSAETPLWAYVAPELLELSGRAAAGGPSPQFSELVTAYGGCYPISIS